jgi:hypothetical protein
MLESEYSVAVRQRGSQEMLEICSRRPRTKKRRHVDISQNLERASAARLHGRSRANNRSGGGGVKARNTGAQERILIATM